MTKFSLDLRPQGRGGLGTEQICWDSEDLNLVVDLVYLLGGSGKRLGSPGNEDNSLGGCFSERGCESLEVFMLVCKKVARD